MPNRNGYVLAIRNRLFNGMMALPAALYGRAPLHGHSTLCTPLGVDFGPRRGSRTRCRMQTAPRHRIVSPTPRVEGRGTLSIAPPETVEPGLILPIKAK